MRVAIVGAGFAGLGMGMALKRAGIEDFAILDRAERVGGVWRENAYPGAACDVPSHLYSFSWAPKRDWSRRFAPQDEILRYLEDCVDRFGLAPHLRLGREVGDAVWDGARWRIDGGLEADVLVTACGQLSRPAYPDVPGLDRFAGRCFHSADWDHDHDLTGERVAVLGTGASAIQFVPAIAPRVRSLAVYQRSAPYVIPKLDRVYGPAHHRLFATVPGYVRAARAALWAYFELNIAGFIGHSALLRPLAAAHRTLLRVQVRDRALREALRPDHELGCKRVLISSDYYRALDAPHVELDTRPVREVTERAVVTTDGAEREVDAIILGTGFRSTEFLAPMAVRGAGGRELSEAWHDGAEAYLGIAVSGFPSFYMLYGPNTNLGSGSIVYMLESQIRYVLDAIRRGRALDLRPEAQDAFRAEMRRRLDRSVWSGCASWYRTESGRITNNWPGFMSEYRWRTRRVRLEDYA